MADKAIPAPQTEWQKVVLDVIKRILSAETPIDSKIASHALLTSRNGVSGGTVKRALDVLEARGIVRARQGAGVFVMRVPTDDDLKALLGNRAREIGFVGEADARIAQLEERQAAMEDQLATLEDRLRHLYDRDGIAYGDAGSDTAKGHQKRNAG